MNWFAVIDCAQDERLVRLVKACRQRVCLFDGKIAPELQAAAPWLVRIDEADPLPGVWREHGRGRSWGILCETLMPLMDLRRHFRRFLQAKLPDGTIALFRFYDPRVFNVYLGAASPEEREPWFRGVDQYAVEDVAGAMHHYRSGSGSVNGGALAVGRA